VPFTPYPVEEEEEDTATPVEEEEDAATPVEEEDTVLAAVDDDDDWANAGTASSITAARSTRRVEVRILSE